MRDMRLPMAHFVILTVGIALVLMLGVVFWDQREKDLVSTWRSEIQRIGAAAAHSAFARSMDDVRADEQHTAAHAFGAALYAEEGIEGLRFCDDRFAQGCLHEVLGLSIADKGTSALVKASAMCADEPAPHSAFCAHAIGHGLVGWLGYSKSDLSDAVRACELYMPAKELIPRCLSGVFMEFNVRLLVDPTRSYRRPAGHDWHEPCIDLDSPERNVCVFTLPRWWREVYVGDGEEPNDVVRQSVGKCAELEEPALRDSCDAGIGYAVAALAHHRADTIRELCGVVAEGQPRALCLAHAANVVLTEAFDPSGAQQVCAGLNESEYAYCSSLAQESTPSAGILDER